MINIFDIERYATKDGPGIRTALFFKGCNLRCIWCQNRESQLPEQQVMFNQNKCAGCERCVEVCPEGAITLREDYGFITDGSKCTRCGKCIDACFYDARKMIGRNYEIDELMEEILADKSFYDESGGGVTFSGGEPLLHHGVVREIALRCRAEGISTAIETAGAVDWKIIEGLLDCIDLFFIDLKDIDSDSHRESTGVGNEKILENIEKLSRTHDNVIVRIPVVPGVNHSEEKMRRIFDFLAQKTRIHEVELLPFHRLGAGKYSGLGMEYPCGGSGNVEKSECAGYEEIGRAMGVSVRTGAV